MIKFLIVGVAALILIGAMSAPLTSKINLSYGDKTYTTPAPVLGMNAAVYSVTYDADTQYVGKCGIVTPPTPDKCDSVIGEIQHSFFGNLVNAPLFKSWKVANPGEYSRLTAHMQAPQCSVAPTGNVNDMISFTGAALVNVVEAYACAGGVGPIAWPLKNPNLDPNRKDKIPPTTPGPLTVTP
jgi:hypothetical protein